MSLLKVSLFQKFFLGPPSRCTYRNGGYLRWRLDKSRVCFTWPILGGIFRSSSGCFVASFCFVRAGQTSSRLVWSFASLFCMQYWGFRKSGKHTVHFYQLKSLADISHAFTVQGRSGFTTLSTLSKLCQLQRFFPQLLFWLKETLRHIFGIEIVVAKNTSYENVFV